MVDLVPKVAIRTFASHFKKWFYGEYGNRQARHTTSSEVVLQMLQRYRSLSSPSLVSVDGPSLRGFDRVCLAESGMKMLKFGSYRVP